LSEEVVGTGQATLRPAAALNFAVRSALAACRYTGGLHLLIWRRGLSMRVLFVIGCGLAGLVIGALVGFGVALIAMSFSPSRADGTFGMREMIVCLPSGALLGLLAASSWALMANHAAG
jgi:hypothetical protein